MVMGDAFSPAPLRYATLFCGRPLAHLDAGRMRARPAWRRVTGRELTAQGRDVSPNHSRSWAPAVFAVHPDAEGVTKKAFAAAMERLLKAKRIAVETIGPPSASGSSPRPLTRPTNEFPTLFQPSANPLPTPFALLHRVFFALKKELARKKLVRASQRRT